VILIKLKKKLPPPFLKYKRSLKKNSKLIASGLIHINIDGSPIFCPVQAKTMVFFMTGQPGTYRRPMDRGV
jgi:hypothetical protein